LASSCSKISKYLSVKSTADVASIGASPFAVPGMTRAGFNSLILLSEANHLFLAFASVFRIEVHVAEENITRDKECAGPEATAVAIVGIALEFLRISDRRAVKSDGNFRRTADGNRLRGGAVGPGCLATFLSSVIEFADSIDDAGAREDSRAG